MYDGKVVISISVCHTGGPGSIPLINMESTFNQLSNQNSYELTEVFVCQIDPQYTARHFSPIESPSHPCRVLPPM